MFSAIAAPTWLMPHCASGHQPDLAKGEDITTSRRTFAGYWIDARIALAPPNEWPAAAPRLPRLSAAGICE